MWDTTTLPPPSEVRGAWWAERVIPEAHTPGTSVLGREAPEDLASVGTAIFGPTRMHVCVRRAAGHLNPHQEGLQPPRSLIVLSSDSGRLPSVPLGDASGPPRGRQDTLWAVPSYPFSHGGGAVDISDEYRPGSPANYTHRKRARRRGTCGRFADECQGDRAVARRGTR